MWEFGGRWYARLDSPAFIEVTGITRERCLEEVRKVTGDDVTLTVEVVPPWPASPSAPRSWDGTSGA